MAMVMIKCLDLEKKKKKKKNLKAMVYSLRPKISVLCASREITLTKYIVKNINIYST